MTGAATATGPKVIPHKGIVVATTSTVVEDDGEQWEAATEVVLSRRPVGSGEQVVVSDSSAGTWPHSSTQWAGTVGQAEALVADLRAVIDRARELGWA